MQDKNLLRSGTDASRSFGSNGNMLQLALENRELVIHILDLSNQRVVGIDVNGYGFFPSHGESQYQVSQWQEESEN